MEIFACHEEHCIGVMMINIFILFNIVSYVNKLYLKYIKETAYSKVKIKYDSYIYRITRLKLPGFDRSPTHPTPRSPHTPPHTTPRAPPPQLRIHTDVQTNTHEA